MSCRPKYGVQYMYETQMDPHQLRQHTVYLQCQVGHPGTPPLLLAANLPLSQVLASLGQCTAFASLWQYGSDAMLALVFLNTLQVRRPLIRLSNTPSIVPI